MELSLRKPYVGTSFPIFNGRPFLRTYSGTFVSTSATNSVNCACYIGTGSGTIILSDFVFSATRIA